MKFKPQVGGAVKSNHDHEFHEQQTSQHEQQVNQNTCLIHCTSLLVAIDEELSQDNIRGFRSKVGNGKYWYLVIAI